MIESAFASHDGVELFYRAWPARSGAAKGAVVLLHRGHEHSGRVAHIVEELGLDDFAFYAWDARGHGRSPGERGHSPSFAHSVRDLDCFVRHISETGGFSMDQVAVVAQSVGAVLASTWVHDYAPNIRALVLASPAFDVKLYVPFAKEGIALSQKLKGTFFVNSYVKARFLTHDPQRIASFEADPLITRPIASNILLELYEAADRVVADARAITVPTQLLVSGSDFVVRHAPQHRFFENLGSTIKERHVLPGFYHDTLGERDRAKALEKVRTFLLQRFAEPPVVADLRRAHLSGHTRDEADRLATPLSLFSPRGLYWALTRASIRLGGLFSRGIETGLRTGFDSGSTLDYVYEDEARGLGPGGRLIDRQFLDAIGWRGIRQRKVHLEALIGKALARLKAEGRPLRVLDIAAGHGRYVLDAVAASEVKPESIRLQDYSPINVEKGTALITDRGLSDVAEFHRADAFDTEGLAAIAPRPTLAIVSGLYELFPDNALIEASLAGLARAMEPGALLLYTGQPWHPQLEMIARALTSHRGGEAWIMRRRTQQEMDQLVAAAGFRKVEQRIDKWGIFTVSLAERI
ncbi:MULTISPECIES: bifunctional alpha/beta hydrolase/class I SAM-dependent methyltransferase [unclassified Shinella]|uniref:bifunctional alpha/beta hydrolase/class I SAM-dependent methyltransferase n=1 Tax=unclassified Shinella TaxID=2643062 RepID=UPI00225D70CB|nr:MULTISPECIES: bifunctional alpha/beta hydrolase/class I SAM-dependent methyltransferase [unclassified Shinella]MCO5137940.1 bifunctional alpha/beta hydrolase/class I SAM-dependent methyltransferase [Shinella sp.]MDC7258057.1 bifunctional alpha/beta hydrolase/class I SAM-dependent methyltransferase [Shinella sp. YE25]CAI0335190.1 hydrolase/methyltransferase domain-containing protein YnbC [Rhizobiaceae bacterium]CAK7259500.1 hydrolase/methyltransferase domain-containing protein YnbC [Shinella 